MIYVALNGLGRIGRNLFRVLMEPETRKKIVLTAINIGPADKKLVPYSLMYDTILGQYFGTITLEGDMLIVDGNAIKLYAETDPLALSWQGVAWVLEASGRFTKKSEALKHIQAGAQRVLISAPSADADGSFVMGINDDMYRSRDTVVSLGSCTTNAVTPLLALLDAQYGVESALFTTVHSYTNDQVLLDVDHHDPRRSRAAALNIIPTSTGASRVVEMVLPQLKNKIKAHSLRVPTAKVSLIDLVCQLKKVAYEFEIEKLFKDAAQGALQEIVGYTNQPLVSCDFNKDSRSVIVDGLLTQVQGSLVKIFGWYDNEWAYSCRMRDFLLKHG